MLMMEVRGARVVRELSISGQDSLIPKPATAALDVLGPVLDREVGRLDVGQDGIE